MKCKECGGRLYLKYYRILKDGTASRRRVCKNCGEQLKTAEIPRSEYESLRRLKNDLQWAVNRYLEFHKQST